MWPGMPDLSRIWEFPMCWVEVEYVRLATVRLLHNLLQTLLEYIFEEYPEWLNSLEVSTESHHQAHHDQIDEYRTRACYVI